MKTIQHTKRGVVASTRVGLLNPDLATAFMGCVSAYGWVLRPNETLTGAQWIERIEFHVEQGQITQSDRLVHAFQRIRFMMEVDSALTEDDVIPRTAFWRNPEDLVQVVDCDGQPVLVYEKQLQDLSCEELALYRADGERRAVQSFDAEGHQVSTRPETVLRSTLVLPAGLGGLLC